MEKMALAEKCHQLHLEATAAYQAWLVSHLPSKGATKAEQVILGEAANVAIAAREEAYELLNALYPPVFNAPNPPRTYY